MGNSCVYQTVSATFAQSCGLDNSHIDSAVFEQPIHSAMREPLMALKTAAAEAGFDLRIASGYRSFARQLHIWNQKASGQWPVLDSVGQPIAIDTLTESELLFAILRWSALPGASRHHWGTDIDIYDARAVSDDYRLQLTVAETCGSGPFAAMHTWLDHWLSCQNDFFRPYCVGIGSVSPEPWHLSFRPLATKFAAALDSDKLRAYLASTDIALKDALINNFQMIYNEYVRAYR